MQTLLWVRQALGLEVHLYAEIYDFALLGREAHLEGILGVGQLCCTAAVNGPEDLGIPSLLVLLGVAHLRLQ